MDSEMQFGDVEQTPTTTRLRPDRNGQFAVATVHSPQATDLPIFVELDVMREMLAHAHSDRRVELGGVLLGGQYEDEQGQPYVVVNDCLRARHYESTKGSFKFTHDTWEQITRERAQLPPEVQMVGWYHTHPDWGVFLSGLDMFICDNFFNRPLDIALVIDPCQADTGFFQWTGQSSERIRRTGGYTLYASRFRLDELREFAAELEGQGMPDSTQTPLMIQTVPPPPPPAWHALVVFAMLTLQFCLMLLIAVRLLPPISDEGPAPRGEIVALRESVDRLHELRQQESNLDAKLEVLEQVVRQNAQAPEGVLKSLAERTQEVGQLRGSLRGQQSLAKELDSKILGLVSEVAEVRRSEESSREEVARLQARISKLDSALSEARELADKRLSDKRGEPVKASWWTVWLGNGKSLGLGALLGAIVVGAVVFAVLRRQPAPESLPETTKVE